MWKFGAISQLFARPGCVKTFQRRDETDRRVVYSPSPPSHKPNSLFCQAQWWLLACSFTLITPKAGLFTGLKPSAICRDAVWHFSLAYKRLPYLGPGLLSPCLPQHWPPTEQWRKNPPEFKQRLISRGPARMHVGHAGEEKSSRITSSSERNQPWVHTATIWRHHTRLSSSRGLDGSAVNHILTRYLRVVMCKYTLALTDWRGNDDGGLQAPKSHHDGSSSRPEASVTMPSLVLIQPEELHWKQGWESPQWDILNPLISKQMSEIWVCVDVSTVSLSNVCFLTTATSPQSPLFVHRDSQPKD